MSYAPYRAKILFVQSLRGCDFLSQRRTNPHGDERRNNKKGNYHKNGNLPLFCIEKDTRGGVLYAPFACAKMVHPTGIVAVLRRKRSVAECYIISASLRAQRKRAIAEWQSPSNGAPDRDRTCNRQNRNLILYPIALRVQKKSKHNRFRPETVALAFV